MDAHGVSNVAQYVERISMDVHQYHEIAELDASNWWYTSRRLLVERLMKTYVPSRGSALDLGCGTGAHASVLQAHADRITGIDPSEEALHHASTRGYDTLLRAGAESIPLPDGSFTFVLATDVLEHVDDRAAVQELRRLLSGDGIVLATVPAFRFLWHGNDDHSHHLRRYSRDELFSLFSENGFHVQTIGYWNRLFFVPVWITARLYRKSDAALKNNLSSIPRFLDPILTLWMRIENSILSFLPFGVSLYIVAKKRV